MDGLCCAGQAGGWPLRMLRAALPLHALTLGTASLLLYFAVLTSPFPFPPFSGLSAKSVDIVFLGSGPYQFAPLPFKYVRPATSADEATAAEAEASSGTSNGALIGE